MKELNEYKAEIFRRSEERILKRIEKKKKTRKLLFSLCVPMCLALIITSALIFSDNFGPPENKVGSEGVHKTDGATSEYVKQYYLYADIGYSEGGTVRIDDPEKINELAELIRLAYKDSYLWYDITDRAEGDMADRGDDDIELYDAELESEAEEVQGYTITLTAPDGYQKVVIIDGNSICDPELDMEATLKQERLEELQEFLTSDRQEA